MKSPNGINVRSSLQWSTTQQRCQSVTVREFKILCKAASFKKTGVTVNEIVSIVFQKRMRIVYIETALFLNVYHLLIQLFYMANRVMHSLVQETVYM